MVDAEDIAAQRERKIKAENTIRNIDNILINLNQSLSDLQQEIQAIYKMARRAE